MSISAGVSMKLSPEPRSALSRSMLIRPHYFMMKIPGWAVFYVPGAPARPGGR
jgi:hypothetical protein